MSTATAVADHDSPVVLFTDNNRRVHRFLFAELAVPELHANLAPAFKELIHSSTMNHPKTAKTLFQHLRRFLAFLDKLEQTPRSLGNLAPDHLKEYLYFQPSTPRGARMTARGARTQVWDMCRILRHVTPYDLLSSELRTHLACLRRSSDVDPTGSWPERPAPPTPGVGTNTAAPTDSPPVPGAQSASRPARTGTGRTSVMPKGRYEAEGTTTTAAQTLLVPFHGEDGRQAVYDFGRLPFPAFHSGLAAAFAARTGPTGGLRTKTSADNTYSLIRRFLTFMETIQRAPQTLTTLRPQHLLRFRLHQLETTNASSVSNYMQWLRNLLLAVEPQDVLSEAMQEFLARPGHARKGATPPGLPGYSDREFRALMAAARRDVVAIRDRIRKAEELLTAYRSDPDALSPEDQETGLLLDEMDRTGGVRPPWSTGMTMPRYIVHCNEVARQLFLTDADLAPLLILTVGLTGRNGETVKELPAAHRLLENRAVAVNLIKRRRGKASSRETVHWETGSNDSRQLHTPGGVYLLLHQLTARGRRFTGDTRIWSIWAGATGTKGTAWDAKAAANGHIDPFAVRLSRVVAMTEWARGHGLTTDDGEPLKVHLGRVKTAVEVRTTKAMGGHLPSASRTNTMDVSFAHYLRGDPIIKDWAEQVLTSALDDAENQVRAFRPRVVTPAQAQLLAQAPRHSAAAHGTTPETLNQALGGKLDTLASACLDIHHGPFTDGRCDVSFLTCLRCPNALITDRHLPNLLAVLDALNTARDAMNIDAWVREHGQTWLIITRLVLPQFTAAQIEAAANNKPEALDLDLLDGPKEA
ncbi:hypothetical protein [Streptomyces sp. NPDC020480]|uniref:hypothetical protein n=1 Tax=Streptomyces sp. NPDC020480 TaxID=3365076 RepID=UPI0037B6D768